MKANEKIYCSLDIETTGFDPLNEEVLEVGFAFFTVSEKGLKITEEWTQVFKPTKQPSPQILALTGIKNSELENAPKFSEHREFIQQKLGNAVIVGHNVAFDIKFLEAFGIKFFGNVVDTLDLAQWILPTHHSYNLENLMHTFKISHKEAHRALADSKATLLLLEKLLQVYSGFSKQLKSNILKLLKKINHSSQDLFSLELSSIKFQDFLQSSKTIKKQEQVVEIKLENKTYYNFSLGSKYEEQLAGAEGKILLVVPKAQNALDLYKAGKVSAAVFLPESMFDSKSFSQLLKKGSPSSEEVKFILKILVWKEINWQTETFLDLNLSFFGGQFKSLITGGKVVENKTAKSVVCDMATFIYLSECSLYKNRQVVICGLNEFENSISANIGSKASWGYINYLLKSFYNPEILSGNEKFKASVGSGLAAGDLFFGLVNALLQKDDSAFLSYKINEDTLNSQEYSKIKSASESFVAKLRETNEVLDSKAIEKFLLDMESFFQPEENRVKWIELSEKRCTFQSMPVDITALVKKVVSPFAKLSLADSSDGEVLPKFFLGRLGLTEFKIQNGTAMLQAKKSNQGDLFAGLKKVMGFKGKEVRFHYLEHAPKEEEYLELLNNGESFPSAVLFASPVLVKEFHEKNFEKLKEKGQVLAQSAYGGSNKILRNFSISPKSLLLATDKFILKAVSANGAVESVSSLPVKVLVISRLSFEQFTHPYQEAVAKSYENSFIDYALPKALFNLHTIVKFFYTPLLEDVYIFDSKLGKDYAHVFKEYYKAVPGAKLVI